MRGKQLIYRNSIQNELLCASLDPRASSKYDFKIWLCSATSCEALNMFLLSSTVINLHFSFFKEKRYPSNSRDDCNGSVAAFIYFHVKTFAIFVATSKTKDWKQHLPKLLYSLEVLQVPIILLLLTTREHLCRLGLVEIISLYHLLSDINLKIILLTAPKKRIILSYVSPH